MITIDGNGAVASVVLYQPLSPLSYYPSSTMAEQADAWAGVA